MIDIVDNHLKEIIYFLQMADLQKSLEGKKRPLLQAKTLLDSYLHFIEDKGVK